MATKLWNCFGCPAIQDLPFDGRALFLDGTDDSLHSFKDSRASLKVHGLVHAVYAGLPLWGSGATISPAVLLCAGLPS